MKQIFMALGFLFSSVTFDASYTVGALDTTSNGGTGFGNATPASATGYVTAGFTHAMQLNGSAIQPDGKIVVVGADVVTGEAIIARYNINGTEDTTFNGFFVATKFGEISAIANAVTILRNGNIVVVGTVTVTAGTVISYFVAQFLPDSSLDVTGFNAGGTPGYVIQNITAGSVDVANAVVVDSFGNIYVVGTSTQIGLGSVFVAKYDSLGVLDTSDYNSPGTVYGGGLGATIPGISLLSIAGADIAGNGAAIDVDNKIVVTGSTSVSTSMLVTRFLENGTLDTAGFNSPTGYNTLNLGLTTVGHAVGFQGNGDDAEKIIIAGYGGNFSTGVPNVFVARYTTGGLLDSYANDTTSPFGPPGEGTDQPGYINDRDMGGLPSYAYGLAIQADDTIVIGGKVTISTNQSLLIARFLADGSNLDTSFSTDGRTTTYIASLDNGNTLSMQENGSFILAGDYLNGINTNFVTARYLGDIPQGCMDLSYNPAIASSPGTPGFSTYPTGSTAANRYQVTATAVLLDNSVFVVTDNIGLGNSSLVQLNDAGQVITSPIIITQSGIKDVVVDENGYAVVVGGNGTNGWIARYVPTTGTVGSPGTFFIDPDFNGGAININTNTSSYSRVAIKSTGNIIAMGQATVTTDGYLGVYLPTGAQTSGTVGMGTTVFTDILIDAANYYYVAGFNTLANFIIISSNNPAFASLSAGNLFTALSSSLYGSPSIAFDSSQNITLIAARVDNATISAQQYDQSGIQIGSTLNIVQADTALTSPVMTRLQVDINNNLIFTGSDQNGFFVGRILANLSGLDAIFAPYSASPGILHAMYSTNNPTDSTGLTTPYHVSNTIAIAPSGSILYGGYENITSSETISLVGQVLGDTNIGQNVRFPGGQMPANGIIDVSFGTDGALDLFTSTAVPHGQPKVMTVLSSNKILLADANGTNTNLVQLTSGYALDTASFGASSGYITLTGLVTPTAMLVDATGTNYYVVGMNSAVPSRAAVYKVNSTGTSGGAAFITTELTAAYGIVQQASGRILIAGKDVTNTGVIVAYTPAGVLDTSFNPSGTTPGYWSLEITNPITALSIGSGDYADKIYFAYDNLDGDAQVGLLLENGTQLDPDFTFETVIASVSDAAQICMQLDSVGNIVLVTNVSGIGIKAARYTAAGANNGSQVTVMATTAGQQLENILCLSDGSTLVLAAEPTASASTSFMQIARLTGGSSSFALDATFNPPSGLLTTNVPSSADTPVMKDFYALDVISTGGILVSGDSSQTALTADPYLTKVTNTSIVTKVAQSTTSLGAPGELDSTFNAAGSNAGFMNLAVELTTDLPGAATSVTSLLQYSNGSYYIGATGSSNSYVTMMSDDDVQNTAWGNTTPTLNGLLTLTGKANLAAMMFTQTGSMVIVGGSGASGSQAGWAVQCSPADGALVTAFVPEVSLDVHCAVGQQSTGRIIVAGMKDGFGILIAYDSVTGAVDTTFGDNGYYTTSSTSQINSMLVDADDSIYIIVNTFSDVPADNNNMQIIKLTPNAVVDSVSSSEIIWSYIFTNYPFYNPMLVSSNHLAFDQDNNIIAAGVRENSGTYTIQILVLNASTGGLITNGSFNTWDSITSVFVDTQVDTPGRIYLTGYNIASGLSPYIACLRIYDGPSINFDDVFGSGTGYISTPIPGTTATDSTWNAGMINANGKITVAGYGAISSVDTPYLMRVYGNEFIGQYTTTVDAGNPGTLNQNFGTNGQIDIAYTVGERSTSGSSAFTMVSQSNGYTFIGFDNGQIIQLTNGGVLNGSYGLAGFAFNGTNGGATQSMMIDGNDQLVAAGTAVGEYNLGWIVRYLQGDSGVYDNSFNESGLIHLVNYFVTNIVQQSLGRYIVTAQNSLTGIGQILAYTTSGALDITFDENGIFDATVSSPLYTVITDQYDRIIYAYKDGSSLTLARLTSSGQYDDSFGSSGRITPAMSSILADSDAQVHVALDSDNNIILAARTSTGISVMAYANTTGISIVEAQLTITSLTNPVLTSVVGVQDGTLLLAGYQSGANNMWIARVKDNGSGTYILDSTFGTAGIMQFSFDTAGTVTARQLNNIAVYGDGQIAAIGYESNSADEPAITPFMAMAYNDPYTTQESSSLTEQPQGTPDQTFGVTTNVGNGIIFYGSIGVDPSWTQIAQAVALQDDNNIVVAINGATQVSESSQILLNMFNVDGLLNTSFNSEATSPFVPGQALVLSMFDDQYVNDMIAYTTAGGISKVILAGAAFNRNLNLFGSLIIQYDLTNAQLDSSFGGLNGNSLGVAFGDAQQVNIVGLQSNGRIIVTGIDQSGNGVVLGYTPEGNLDQSFGQGGIFAQGTTGIYAQAIDAQDNIVIAYLDETTTPSSIALARILSDGSALDASFGIDGTIATDLDYRIYPVNSPENMAIAFKQDGSIVLVGVLTSATSIVINVWNSTGTSITQSLTISSGAPYNLTLNPYSLSNIFVDSLGKIIIIGSDYASLIGNIIVIRTGAHVLTPDSTFNSAGTPGYIRYDIGDSDNVNSRNALIHPDGRIIIVGSLVTP